MSAKPAFLPVETKVPRPLTPDTKPEDTCPPDAPMLIRHKPRAQRGGRVVRTLSFSDNVKVAPKIISHPPLY
jgi:hypothetical protein